MAAAFGRVTVVLGLPQLACIRTAIPCSEAVVGEIGIQHGNPPARPQESLLAKPCWLRTSTTCPSSSRSWIRKWLKGMAHITGGGLTEKHSSHLPWAVRLISVWQLARSADLRHSPENGRIDELGDVAHV
jgi:hypothetical protein